MYKRAIINTLRSATDRYDYVIAYVMNYVMDYVIVDNLIRSLAEAQLQIWNRQIKGMMKGLDHVIGSVHKSGLSGQPMCRYSRKWNKLDGGAREQPPNSNSDQFRHFKILGRDYPFLEWADLVITVVVTFLEGCNFESFFYCTQLWRLFVLVFPNYHWIL